jgi:hypothetical protein
MLFNLHVIYSRSTWGWLSVHFSICQLVLVVGNSSFGIVSISSDTGMEFNCTCALIDFLLSATRCNAYDIMVPKTSLCY